MTILNRVQLYSYHNPSNNSLKTLFKPFKSFHQKFHLIRSTTSHNSNFKYTDSYYFTNFNNYKRAFNTITRHSKNSRSKKIDKNTINASDIIERKKVKEWSELSTGEKGLELIELIEPKKFYH